MARVMQKWVEESLNALEEMELQLQEREASVEQAMATIRRHSDDIEKLEKNIAIVREALGKAEHQLEALPAEAQPGPPAPPLRAVSAPPPTPPQRMTRAK